MVVKVQFNPHWAANYPGIGVERLGRVTRWPELVTNGENAEMLMDYSSDRYRMVLLKTGDKSRMREIARHHRRAITALEAGRKLRCCPAPLQRTCASRGRL